MQAFKAFTKDTLGAVAMGSYAQLFLSLFSSLALGEDIGKRPPQEPQRASPLALVCSGEFLQIDIPVFSDD